MKFTQEIFNYKQKKGVILIIVIFIMIIIGLVGNTVANFISANLDINARHLDSERALYLSESAMQWALKELTEDSSFRTTGNGQTHTLAYGEYRVICRDPIVGEDGDTIVETYGYVPNQVNPRAERQLISSIVIGGLTSCLKAKNNFDWSLMHPNSSIEGNIQAAYYNGDGDAVFNEIGQDYDPSPIPIMPDGKSGDDRTLISPGAYPTIDMAYFESNADIIWQPDPITATALDSSSGNTLNVTVNGFFTGMVDEAVRNITHGTWNDTDWAVIQSVSAGGKQASLDRNINDDWDSDQIKLVKRFYKNEGSGSSKTHYIKSGLIIDVNISKITLKNMYVITEGDVLISGDKQIKMTIKTGEKNYPSLATKTGDIISLDTPEGNTENKKRDTRIFRGLIYSEQGTVTLNYLNGLAVYGNNVILDGRILINYSANRIDPPSGTFLFQPSSLSWQEQ